MSVLLRIRLHSLGEKGKAERGKGGTEVWGEALWARALRTSARLLAESPAVAICWGIPGAAPPACPGLACLAPSEPRNWTLAREGLCASAKLRREGAEGAE